MFHGLPSSINPQPLLIYHEWYWILHWCVPPPSPHSFLPSNLDKCSCAARICTKPFASFILKHAAPRNLSLNQSRLFRTTQSPYYLISCPNNRPYIICKSQKVATFGFHSGFIILVLRPCFYHRVRLVVTFSSTTFTTAILKSFWLMHLLHLWLPLK